MHGLEHRIAFLLEGAGLDPQLCEFLRDGSFQFADLPGNNDGQ